MLAATKTDDQLVHGNPLSFGSWHALRANWDALTALPGRRRSSCGCATRRSTPFLALVDHPRRGRSPPGYALAMTEFRGRRTLLVATLVVMLMPNATLVVPLFLEINAVHLIGSMWSIILPYSFYPFGVYLTYIYFSTALPKDLLDAARIDGCSRVRRLPARRAAAGRPRSSRSSASSASWRTGPTTSCRTSCCPRATSSRSRWAWAPCSATCRSSTRPPATWRSSARELALATLLAITPVLVVFLFSQRFLVSGMLAGATKD